MKTSIYKIVFTLIVSALIIGCVTVARFDQYSYVQSTSLKVDAIALMDESTEEYSVHQKDIRSMEIRLLKALEYERFRPQNQISVDMWHLLIDPNGNLLGGYFALWKKQGRCSPSFIARKKDQVTKAFDEISALEGKKIR